MRTAKGFAIVPHPADYGVSGILTFVTNRNGISFQNKSGLDAEKLAAAIDAYGPDDTRTVVTQ